MKTVLFAPNGITGVFDESGNQIPELQQPWIQLFIAFLESQGQDPQTFTYELPNGGIAKPFKVGDGWNWDISL